MWMNVGGFFTIRINVLTATNEVAVRGSIVNVEPLDDIGNVIAKGESGGSDGEISVGVGNLVELGDPKTTAVDEEESLGCCGVGVINCTQLERDIPHDT